MAYPSFASSRGKMLTQSVVKKIKRSNAKALFMKRSLAFLYRKPSRETSVPVEQKLHICGVVLKVIYSEILYIF